MFIKLSQKHIDMGQQCSSDHCPYALALKEVFPDRDIRVGLFGFFYNREFILNNKDVRDRIVEYDVNGRMEPHEFEFSSPW